MWLAAVVVAIIGDVITTSFGVLTPGIVESNPLWQDFYTNHNFVGLFVGQVLIVSFGFSIDYIMVRELGSWAFPLIPAYFIYVGTTATINNLLVLNASEANGIAITVLVAGVGIAFIEVIHSRFGYPLF